MRSCKNIAGRARAEDLFEIVNDFFEEKKINWEDCIGVCTDGARAMAGKYGGLQALIWDRAPDMLWTHCILYREVLASKYLNPSLNFVMDCVINAVNYIKSNPVKARLFKRLCEDMSSEHTSLLYYSSSRWLSRGNVMLRAFELREEIFVFLKEEKHIRADDFANDVFKLKLAYLCDLFEKFNSLNLSLQGKNMHYLKSMEKILAFIKKLRLWKSKMSGCMQNDSFPVLKNLLLSSQDVSSLQSTF